MKKIDGDSRKKLDRELVGLCRRYFADDFAQEVSRCLEKGANVNAQWDEGGLTTFHCAAQRNAPEVMKVLLADKRANPHILDNKGRTARDFAQRLGHTETLEVLDAYFEQRSKGPVSQKTRSPEP